MEAMAYYMRPSSSTLGFKFSSNVLYDTSEILISTIVIQNCLAENPRKILKT